MTLLFDLDGTIIDSTEAIVESFGVAYNTFGTPVPESHAIIELIGLPLLTMFERLGIPSTLAQDYVDTYKAHYRTVATAKTYILPFAKEAIHKASAFATLGVVTTKTGRYSEEILTHLGVRDYFSTIVGFEHVTHPKPHPEPILTALNALNVPANSDVWMIGDTPLDICCANDAHVKHVALTSGYASYETLASYTSIIHPHVLAAVDYIYEQTHQ